MAKKRWCHSFLAGSSRPREFCLDKPGEKTSTPLGGRRVQRSKTPEDTVVKRVKICEDSSLPMPGGRKEPEGRQAEADQEGGGCKAKSKQQIKKEAKINIPGRPPLRPIITV